MSRITLLRVVLVGFAAGHLTTAAIFTFWPGWFINAAGARPPWPVALIQFGAWPPLHTGFMHVLAAYDTAVAFALLLAARRPREHRGIIAFAIALWSLHAFTHAEHIVLGTSPVAYWVPVGVLASGAILLAALWPRTGRG